jgi:hypothetical protein
LFDPFEFLYLAIAIATFEHSTWTAAFMFEGTPPVEEVALRLWYFKGALIAVAIDVGMLMSSRFIAHTTDLKEVLSLIAAFAMTAVASLFTQVGYIVFHTPEFNLSAGVSDYWVGVLTPIIEARVVILPFLLPLMGTIYTVARIFRTKRIQKQEAMAIANRRVAGQPYIMVESLADMVKMLDDGMRPKLPHEILDEEYVDWEGLRFFDVDKQVWRGKYPSRDVMIQTMRGLAKKREEASIQPVLTDGKTDA